MVRIDRRAPVLWIERICRRHRGVVGIESSGISRKYRFGCSCAACVHRTEITDGRHKVGR